MTVRVVIDPAGLAEIEALAVHFRNSILDEISADAARYAPRRTGKLANSVHSDHASGRVVASADYAGYVELGTRNMHAQPYLRPATYQKRGRS